MHKYLSIILIALFFFLQTGKAEAADCPIVYGGGEINCEKTVSTPTPDPVQNFTDLTQSKGGLPVSQPTAAATTPATGPEAFGLISLLSAGGLGFFLRKKRDDL